MSVLEFVQPARSRASEDVCAVLRGILAEAERGELDAFAAIALNGDGTPSCYWANADVAVLGGIKVLADELSLELRGE